MIVKCPKCRFKYEMPVAPGTKELACVCSRCGFPFSYTGPEETQNEVHQESVVQTRQPSVERSIDRRDIRRDNWQRNNDRQEMYEYEENEEQQMQVPPYHPYSNRNRGCARQMFIVFLLILIISVFALRHCYYDRSYTAETIVSKEMPKNTEKDDLSEIVPSEDDNDVDEFTEVRPQEPPQWLQGSWTVETPEGPINIFIKGNHIAESFKGETQSGTFYYSEGKIYCNFGNNEESIRNVDLQRQRIDAGGGLMMEKRDF